MTTALGRNLFSQNCNFFDLSLPPALRITSAEEATLSDNSSDNSSDNLNDNASENASDNASDNSNDNASDNLNNNSNDNSNNNSNDNSSDNASAETIMLIDDKIEGDPQITSTAAKKSKKQSSKMKSHVPDNVHFDSAEDLASFNMSALRSYCKRNNIPIRQKRVELEEDILKHHGVAI